VTPGQYIAAAKDILIVLAIGIVVFLVYRAGEDRIHASDLNGLRDELKQQRTILGGWQKESNDATNKLSADVAAIRATPPVAHVWVHNQPIPQPAVLPSPTVTPSAAGAPAGGVQPGRGADVDGARRDAILDAFKKRWEERLAEWRAEDSQWPKP